jgi:ABC-type branched-subunit amino acid transport system substrate-binding protein/predicted negative regulator of RcsB-dependent stress response
VAQRLVALIALLALASCALPRPRILGPTDAEKRAYEAALATARRDPEQGRTRLAAFVDRNPDSTLADDAVIPLARLEVRAKRPAEAERRLRAVLRKHPKENRSDTIRLELAKLLRAKGDSDGAWKVARDIKPSQLREAERADANRLLAELANDRGDAAARLEYLARLRASASPDEVVAVDRDIESTLAAMPVDELVQVADRLGDRVPAGRVWLRAGELALRGGDTSTAARAFSEAERLPLQPDEAAQLARLQGALESRRAAPLEGTAPPPLTSVAHDGEHGWPASAASGAIGVVLPFSGPFAKVAEDVLRGALLASGSFGGDPASPTGLRILVRDSGGKPDRAAAAVRELGLRGDVAAVVGPLTKEEVEAAGVAAQEVGVPLLSLTRHEAVARDRAEVVRFGLTRRMEVEVLADHAVRELGLTRIAILYPKDEYGREFEALLWQAVEERGGRVVGVAGYPPSATDFAVPIRRLLGPQAEAASSDPAAAAGTPPPPPLVDFDALFIPDAHDKVGLIALQLAASQVSGVRLLGPSGWHHPDLLRVAGPLVDGAFFSSGFDPSHPSALIQDFVARYHSAFDAAPTPFAAQGFDAANLVGLQLVRGAQTPAEVRAGLLATELYPGVSGVTSIGADGDARKRPFLIEVREGHMASLE